MLRVGRYQHAPMMNAEETISNADLNCFSVKPHPNLVRLTGEADVPGTTNLAGRDRLNSCLLYTSDAADE